MSEEHIWQKRTFWVTIVGIIATVGVTLWVSGGTSAIKEYLEGRETESQQAEAEGKASVKIEHVYVTPTKLDIPSYFFLEITSHSIERPSDITVSIDFGPATPDSCDVAPKEISSWSAMEKSSIRLLQISKIEESQSVYVACTTDLPYFTKILIFGDNLFSEAKLDFDGYRAQQQDEPLGFWWVLWRIVVVVLTGIFLLGIGRLVLD